MGVKQRVVKGKFQIKSLVRTFKSLKVCVGQWVDENKGTVRISNKQFSVSQVTYFLVLKKIGIELIVKSSSGSHMTFLNFKNGEISSTLYQTPAECMEYLTGYIDRVFSDLALDRAEIY